jgi:hypothetical protein
LYSGIIENTVERRKFLDDLSRGVAYGAGIRHVQYEVPYPWICGADAPQTILSPAADNDLIPQEMKRFGEPFSNTGSAARDENRVGTHFHEIFPYNP